MPLDDARPVTLGPDCDAPSLANGVSEPASPRTQLVSAWGKPGASSGEYVAGALDGRYGSRVDHRQDEHGPDESPQFQHAETGNLHRLHRPSSGRKTFRVRIEDLLLPPNLPAGMDVLTLFSLAALLHKTTEDPEPVSVRHEQSHWRITDGRHRAIAALIAGRTDVLAEETA